MPGKYNYINYIVLVAIVALSLHGIGCSDSDSITAPKQAVDPNRITAIAPFAGALMVFKGDGSQYTQYANGEWSEPRPTSDLNLPFGQVGAMGWYNGSAMAVNASGTHFATFNGKEWTAATDVKTLAGYPMDTIGAIGSFRGHTYFYNRAGDRLSVNTGNRFESPTPTSGALGTVGAMGGEFRGRVIWVDAGGVNFFTQIDNPDRIYWPAGSGPVAELDDLPPIIGFEIESFYVESSCDIDGTGEFDYDITVSPRSWSATNLGEASGSVSAKGGTHTWIRDNYRLIPHSGPVDITFWCRENDVLGSDLFMNGKTTTGTHTVTRAGSVSGASSGQRFKLILSGVGCRAEAWYRVRIYN